MRKQNFKSDFDFVLALKDSDGNDLGFPEVNWELLLLTSSRQLAYTASYQYGEKQNIVNDSGKIKVIVDRHEFPVGELLYEFTAEVPDASFPDGSRRVFMSGSTDIEIVNEKGQTLTDVIVPVGVPYLKKEEEKEEETPVTPPVTNQEDGKQTE